MKTEWFELGETPLWHTNKFGGYRLTEVTSVDDVLTFCNELAAEWAPEAQPLLLAGKVDQALYTAGHVLEYLEPPDTEGMPCDQYAAEVLRVLERDAALVDIETLKGALGGIDEPGDGIEMSKWNADPLTQFDEPSWLLKVPALGRGAAFVGAPVGYSFVVDSRSRPAPRADGHAGAAHVFRLIQHWHDRHGYEFRGVGAARIHFAREMPLTQAEVTAVVEDVGAFQRPHAAAQTDDLETALLGKRMLVLSFRNW